MECIGSKMDCCDAGQIGDGDVVDTDTKKIHLFENEKDATDDWDCAKGKGIGRTV